jgi:ABC-type transport system substrate-binding protein
MLNILISNPRATLSRTESKNAIITTPDERTVRIELPLKSWAEAAMLSDYAISGYPKEVVEKYGLPLAWDKAIGTGAFMLTDYVPSSAATLGRNPDYWMTDPVGAGKGNQLPYVDRVKLLIITDLSTRLAAIRTAKIDVLNNIDWEDAEQLKTQSSQLSYKKFPNGGSVAIMMRNDKPELPFDDINVRHALMMATDYETIKETFCGGEAVILSWPITYVKEYADCYLSLEEVPENIKELYTYNADRARELLADAGYPDGFVTKIVTSNSPQKNVDYLSIIADQWSKVGVELQIEPLEPGVMTSVALARSHEEMEYGSCGPAGNAFIGAAISTRTMSNGSYIDDPIVNETLAAIGPLSISDTAEAARLYKELMKHVLYQAWALPSPSDRKSVV